MVENTRKQNDSKNIDDEFGQTSRATIKADGFLSVLRVLDLADECNFTYATIASNYLSIS
jgi:hypothetical protein